MTEEERMTQAMFVPRQQPTSLPMSAIPAPPPAAPLDATRYSAKDLAALNLNQAYAQQAPAQQAPVNTSDMSKFEVAQQYASRGLNAIGGVGTGIMERLASPAISYYQGAQEVAKFIPDYRNRMLAEVFSRPSEIRNKEQADLYQKAIAGSSTASGGRTQQTREDIGQEVLPLPTINQTPYEAKYKSVAPNAPINTGASTAAYQGNQNAAKDLTAMQLKVGPTTADGYGATGMGGAALQQPAYAPSMPTQAENPYLRQVMNMINQNRVSNASSIGDLVASRINSRQVGNALGAAKQFSDDYVNSTGYQDYTRGQKLGSETFLQDRRAAADLSNAMARLQAQEGYEDKRMTKKQQMEAEQEARRSAAKMSELQTDLGIIAGDQTLTDEQKRNLAYRRKMNIAPDAPQIDKDNYQEFIDDLGNVSKYNTAFPEEKAAYEANRKAQIAKNAALLAEAQKKK